MKRLCAILLLVLVALPCAGQAKPDCGLERWSVKTLADSHGPAVSRSLPRMTTIRELVGYQAPPKQLLRKANATRFLEETAVYQVQALVIGYKREADSDFHIVLADPENPKITMIAEIPAGACVPPEFKEVFDALQASFAANFSKPTTAFHRLRVPVPAVFTGVGFFDFLHGQTGVAPNGFELHPVLSFSKRNALLPTNVINNGLLRQVSH